MLRLLLVALVDFFYFVQQGVGWEEEFWVTAWQDLFETNDSVLVDNHVRSIRRSPLFFVHAVRLHHLAVPVAQKRVLDLDEIDECLLRKRRVGADSYDFGVLGGKLGIVLVRTGRLQVSDSARAEIQDVEINQDIFALEAA